MNNNGKISIPINTTDVRTVLQSSSTNIGYLCSNQHKRTNKWSLYKPVSFKKLSKLNDSDFFSIDFGYSIPSYNNFSSMKSGVTDGWTYLPPTGGENSPYRIGDFDKYDHRSTAPFALELTNQNTRLGEFCRFQTPTEITWLTNWNTWKDYKGSSMQYLNCGVYVKGVGYYPFTSTRDGLTISDLDISKLNFEITKGKFTVGSTYSVYLILTTWDGLNGPQQWYNPADNEGGIWWVLATDNPLTFKVQKELSPFDYITVSGSGTANMQETSSYFTWTNVNLNISVKVNAEYPERFQNGTLQIDVIIPQHYTGSSAIEKTILSFNIQNINANFSQSYNKNAQDFNLLSSKEDSTNANVELKLKIGSDYYYDTTNLNIVSI